MESVLSKKRPIDATVASTLGKGIREKLFRPELVLLPQVNEVYELSWPTMKANSSPRKS